MKFLLFSFLLPFCLFASAPENIRKSCADQINAAFEMQSRGITTQAFYAWKKAYTILRENGESPHKLAPLLDLFIWYRTYGYSCGVTFNSSGCTEEYRPNRSLFKTVDYRDFDARQKKIVRDFLFGTGCIVCGVLCVAINPPLGSQFGAGLVIAGGTFIYTAISEAMEDYEEKKERLKELNQITNKAAAVAQ